MDQTDQHHKLQSLTQFITSQFLKKTTHLLLSLSVFSFFFSYSSWYCFLLHSFNFHFSTFSFQLPTQTIDKNCIFLICNGIVMVLAKTSSGFIPSSPASDHLNDQLFKKIGDGEDEDALQSSLETKDSFLEKEVSVETTEPLENVVEEEEEEEEEDSMEGESEEYSDLIVEGKEQEDRTGYLITVGGEDEENEKELGTINDFVFEEEEEEEDGLLSTVGGEDEENEKELGTINDFVFEEEEEEDGLLSREELNKKFDEFIRKTKEEIRIGARQQLVVA